MAGEPTGGSGELLILTDDPLIARRLHQLAAEHGLVVSSAGPAQDAPGDGPAATVIDLHRADALEWIRACRKRWPAALIAGYLSMPDRERWVAAQRAGCDLVANRGALILRLRDLLRQPGEQAGRRFPLFEAADAAGRLGLVFATQDTPVGPVAVYQVAGGLHAVADRCPHAGATLSAGDLEGGVITCPRHGSRFDVTTGERVRGPADTGLACHWLIQQGGQVFLVLPG